jgi:hypothetical protein
MRFLLCCVVLVASLSSRAAEVLSESVDAPLVVLAAPSPQAYADAYQTTLDYVVQLAEILDKHQSVVVLASGRALMDLSLRLPKRLLVDQPLGSAELEAFIPFGKPVLKQFRIPNNGDAAQHKRYVEAQRQLRHYNRRLGLGTQLVDIQFSASQWQDNGGAIGIVSDKVLSDNQMAAQSAHQVLARLLGVSLVVPVSLEGPLPLNSMLAWLGPKQLMINRYPQPFRSQLLNQLAVLGSDIQVFEAGRSVKMGASSMCGRYSGVLSTPSALYLPLFNLAEESVLISELARYTHKQVIPIESSAACQLGLSPRRLAWVVEGEFAQQLRQQTLN